MPCPGNRSDPCRTAPAQVRAAFRQERNEARGMCQQEPLTHPLRSVPACPPRKRAARARRLRRPSWLVCARRSRERTGFDFDVPRRESVGCVYALLQGRAEMDFNVGYNFRVHSVRRCTRRFRSFVWQVQTQRLWLYQAGVLTAKSRICTVGPSQVSRRRLTCTQKQYPCSGYG
jgi:hypothetical protein